MSDCELSAFNSLHQGPDQTALAFINSVLATARQAEYISSRGGSVQTGEGFPGLVSRHDIVQVILSIFAPSKKYSEAPTVKPSP